MMEVTVEIKSVFGRDLIYPTNETGKLLTRLAGTKTFDTRQINLLKALGYTFTQKEVKL